MISSSDEKLLWIGTQKSRRLPAPAARGRCRSRAQQEPLLPKRISLFMDLDEIYFEMQRFKNERAWFNLNLSREKYYLNLLKHPEWYDLYIPKDVLEFRSFEQVRQWQEIAIALLKKYCDRVL